MEVTAGFDIDKAGGVWAKLDQKSARIAYAQVQRSG
jgi:hypothetical protein